MILEKEENNQAETSQNDTEPENDIMICTTSPKPIVNVSSNQFMALNAITRKSKGPTPTLLAAVAASKTDKSRSTYHK